MGVLSVSYHGCIRVVKEGLALLNAGVPVDFMAIRIANREMQVMLPSISFYDRPETYKIKLGHAKADLLHIHNEPDWLVHVAKEARPDLPLVYDCHDLNCMRLGQAQLDEVLAMKAADAYIFPSEPYMEGAIKYHNLSPDKPKAVIYSMCLDKMIVEGNEMPRVGGIAYEGGMNVLSSDASEEQRQVYGYRDYRPIAEALTGMGIPFIVYSSNNRFMYEYMMAGAMYISTLQHNLLLRELTRHDWGLVGAARPHPQADTAMPNKLFEYMTAGIPPIVLNSAEAGKFVEHHGIGVVVDRVEDIPKVYKEHEKYRKRVQEVRHDFTMESQVPKIKAIYDTLLEGKGKANG